MTCLEDDLHVAIFHCLAPFPSNGQNDEELSLEDKWPKEIQLYKYSRACSPDMKLARQKSIWYVKAQEKPILAASTLSELKLKAAVAFGVDKIFKTGHMAKIAIGDTLTREHFAELKLA